MNGNAPQRRQAAGGVGIGRLFGIEIRLHFSVLLIFGLVAWSLAAHTFPGWHPDWSPALSWGLGLATAVLFFVSLLAHEFAHSLVAKWKGLQIDRITLFLFGGMAELKTQPKTAGVEFMVAIAGPLMSVAIGLGSIGLAAVLVDGGFAQRLVENPEVAMASLGPLPTLLLWLGPINLFLAAFNMMPGFPLDGGRVLRAALWAISGDMQKATRWAAYSGRVVAFMLMGLGGLEIFFGGFINGLWLLFIGWFLFSAARAAQAESELRASLQGHRLSELMDTGFEFADGNDDVESFARERLMHRSQAVWPVLENGQLVGIVTIDDIAQLPPEARPHTRLARLAKPLHEVDFVEHDLPGPEILKRLAESDYGVVLVVKDNQIIGLLRQSDVVRWLTIHTA